MDEKIAENAPDFFDNNHHRMDKLVRRLEVFRNPAWCNHHLQDAIHPPDEQDFVCQMI